MLSSKHPLVSHVPNGDYHRESPCTFGASLAIPHTEQNWKLYEDFFQDACVKHNEAMRTMTPLLACIHLSLNPQSRAIMIKTMMVAIVIPSSTIVSVSSSACPHFNCLWIIWPFWQIFVLQRFLHWMFYCKVSTDTELHESGLLSPSQSQLPDHPAQHHQPSILPSPHTPALWYSLNS